MTNRKPSLPHRKHLDRQDSIFLFLHVQLQLTIMSPKGGVLLPLSDCIFWKNAPRKTKECWDWGASTCERIPTVIPGQTGNASFLSPLFSQNKTREGRTKTPGHRTARQLFLVNTTSGWGMPWQTFARKEPSWSHAKLVLHYVVQFTTPSLTKRFLECAKLEVKLQPCNQSFLFGLPHKAARKLSNYNASALGSHITSYGAVCFLQLAHTFLVGRKLKTSLSLLLPIDNSLIST